MREINVRFRRADGGETQLRLPEDAALESALEQLDASRFIDTYDLPEWWGVTFEGDAQLLDARRTLAENGIGDGAVLRVATDLFYTPQEEQAEEQPGGGKRVFLSLAFHNGTHAEIKAPVDMIVLDALEELVCCEILSPLRPGNVWGVFNLENNAMFDVRRTFAQNGVGDFEALRVVQIPEA